MMNVKKKVPIKFIERGTEDEDYNVREAAMNACHGREVPIKFIERGIKDKHWCVRAAALNACHGREVPIKFIERGMKDEHWRVREAAMNACHGREVPIDVIERGMKDENWSVRAAATKACHGREVPIIRAFEPPEKVYKKCLGDVIVVAEIPKDAQVRGAFGKKCRSNKAKIVDVIGDVCGESVGISSHDLKTTYYPGDVVEIENFDFSNQECSTGFHFFCTIDEAKGYRS